MFLTDRHRMNNDQPIDQSEENLESTLENAAEPKNEASEIDQLKAQVAESNDKFLRLYAEFDNYKRRTMKERAELLQMAGKEVILSLLPVVDDFERAKKADVQDITMYKEGIDLIHHKFNSILSAKGLKAIESIGQAFNVDKHEAITNIPAASEDMKGKVVDETEKGYELNGHVIRFAKVVVGE